MNDTPGTGRDDLLAAALRMTASMAEEENILALLAQGLSLCIRILNCERGLLISESADGDAQILAHQGFGDAATPYSTTALQLVKEKNEPLLISDTITDELLGVQESINRQDIRSVLCARLDTLKYTFADTQVFLYLDSRTTRQSFTLADLDTFRLLCVLMANLVKKSELLVAQEAQIEELKRSKVNVTPVVPGLRSEEHDHVSAAVESETF